MFQTKRTTNSSSVAAIIFFFTFLFGYSTSQLYEGNECELKDGSLGVCKSFVLCRWAMEGLNQRVIAYKDISRCSFEGSNEIICCGDEKPVTSEKPEPGSQLYDGGEDGIYFVIETKLTILSLSEGTFFNNRVPVTTSTARSASFIHPINQIVENIITTSQRPTNRITTQKIRTTTRVTPPPAISSTTSFAVRPPPTMRSTTSTLRSTTATIRSTTPSAARLTTPSAVRLTTPSVRFTTSSTRRPTTPFTIRPTIDIPTTSFSSQPTIRFILTPTTVRPTARTTIHSFWSEWAPTNNVDSEMLPGSVNTQNNASSNLEMAPWLLEILNEAMASTNISTTTQNNVGTNVQFGDGFNDVDNEIGGGSDNNLSPSRQKTTPPPTNNTPVPPIVSPSVPPTRIGQRRSEIACENYTTLSSPYLSFNILVGVPTGLGEFPHMAALGFPSQEFGGKQYDFNCGGSIISETYVLTAAHCVTDRNLPTIVRSGKLTLHSNDDETEGVTSTIAEIIPHPNYVPSRRYDDIALIRVADPIPFGDYVRPACLRSNMSDVEPNEKLIVTGWGKTSVERAQRSEVLLKTDLSGVSLEACNASLLDYNPNDRSLRNGVNLGQICAHDPQMQKDTCEGDSGGPMQTYNPNGMSTIVGVTSFGISCGSALPSVYARVAFYLDWIESIVWPNR